MNLKLETLPGEYTVYRLPPDRQLPARLPAGFASITRTPEELSIVAPAGSLEAEFSGEPGCRRQSGFHGIRVSGSLDFNLTGILAHLSGCLAEAGIPLLAIATFDTDYLFVPVDARDRTHAALRAAGFQLTVNSDPAGTG